MRFANIGDAELLYEIATRHPNFMVGSHSLEGFKLMLLREPVVLCDSAFFIFTPFSSWQTFCVHPLGWGKDNVTQMQDAMELMRTIGARVFVALPYSDHVKAFFAKAGFAARAELKDSVSIDGELKTQTLMVLGG